ncbi:Hpt domain-containing protein [Halorussus caseinilyticus]|uniref:Hpt domain-containing protein n=1 Tax=Halorussus caseinilyticus TaxID=3034025 RepID=A0ABD5WJR0_9EURY
MVPTDDAFYRETKSQIRALNDGLLAVEDDAENVAVAELFRVAHSLKGSCRTHGLDEAGALAHAVEDALDALRGGEVRPTPTLIDETLDAVDLLEATVRADATGGEVETDPEAIRASLRATLDAERDRVQTDSDALPDSAAADFGESGGDWDPADDGLSDDVVAALEDTAEFDDIDSLLDGMDAPEDDAELDGWGMLGDGDDSPGASADDSPAGDPADDSGSAETPDRPSAFFEETKAEIDESGDIHDLQEDIDAVEFGEFDDEDNYTIEELMDLEPGESPDETPEDGPPSSATDTESPSDGDPLDLSADLLGSADADDGVADAGDEVSEEATETGTFVFGETEDEGTESEQTPGTESEQTPGTESEPGSLADASEPADVEVPDHADMAADSDAGASESASVGDAGSETDSVPDRDSVPETDSVPDDVPELDALSEEGNDSVSDAEDEPDSVPDDGGVPDPDSMPETDLGMDLSGEFDAGLGPGGESEAGIAGDTGLAADTGMDVSVDEEMAEFNRGSATCSAPGREATTTARRGPSSGRRWRPSRRAVSTPRGSRPAGPTGRPRPGSSTASSR